MSKLTDEQVIECARASLLPGSFRGGNPTAITLERWRDNAQLLEEIVRNEARAEWLADDMAKELIRGVIRAVVPKLAERLAMRMAERLREME